MSADRQTAQTITLRGEGPTPVEAFRSLLAALLADVLNRPARPGDQATVVRASAPALPALIPAFVNAMLASAADLDLVLTDATLDGLIATDDGWRAWGTISGEPASVSTRPAWRAGPATAAVGPGGAVLELTMQRDPTDG